MNALADSAVTERQVTALCYPNSRLRRQTIHWRELDQSEKRRLLPEDEQLVHDRASEPWQPA